MKLFKKILKILGYILLSVTGLMLVTVIGYYIYKSQVSSSNLKKLGPEAPKLTENGIQFRDLNKNGQMDTYENPKAGIDARVDDLLSQMTLEEKAGTMFITMIGMSPKGNLMEAPILTDGMLTFIFSMALPSNTEMVINKKMNSFNTLASNSAEVMATYNNNLQKIAERTRLGIPVTLASDPRHVTENNPGAGIFTPSFSKWPNSLGLAASRDTVLTREFGDIARQEYLAVGLRLALHPMADLATEPRWGRINGTFGEDAKLSAALTKAYVQGFQGDQLNSKSVACMTKHFSGGGPQKDGEDPHFPYGKEQAYPGDNFAYHVIPFTEGAFEANTAQIMPYYGIPMDQTQENVAFAFNKDIITGLLRDSLGFEGVVCTDWNIITNSSFGEGRAWGVEKLSTIQRVKKVIDAGCDQFGGEAIPELIVELVKSGQISEKRIDVSVKRILKDKFKLGLFDNPYVEAEKANQIANQSKFDQKGEEAQRKSVVMLKNDQLLPLKKGTKIYAEGISDSESIQDLGELVNSPEKADVILLRLKTPFDPRNKYFLESFFHQGRLYFDEKEQKRIQQLITQKPSIVFVQLDRPAILTEIDQNTKALLAEFGLEDKILFELIYGKTSPNGKLPFELPSSWDAVLNQQEDVPYDSKAPLYKFGHGLTY